MSFLGFHLKANILKKSGINELNFLFEKKRPMHSAGIRQLADRLLNIFSGSFWFREKYPCFTQCGYYWLNLCFFEIKSYL